MRTYIPLKLGIAEVRQPIRYLTLGDPCTHCCYPPHEEVECPPPPVYPQPPEEDNDTAAHSDTVQWQTPQLPVQHPPPPDQDNTLPCCSPPIRRAYVNRQGVNPPRSAPTRTDYAITHGFPTAPPRHPPLDLNAAPQTGQPMDMEDPSQWTLQEHLRTWELQLSYLKDQQQRKLKAIYQLDDLEHQLAVLHEDNDLSPEYASKIRELTTQIQNI
ncbi:hypothetical protein R1sor_019668 [Riccia sorocarpa]|uniref:Uncharacterized protein n=1 Tax=Riccia sorocarpa TaxID=122646 RepID=A0ABD3IDT8_9MARC